MHDPPERFQLAVRRCGLGAVLALLLGSSGCLQSEHHLTLHPDGTGTLRMVYRIPAETLARTGSPGTEDPYTPERIREGFAGDERHGLSITGIESTESSEGRTIRADFTFDSLAGLAHTRLYRESLLSLERTERGTMVFRQAPATPRTTPRPPEQLAALAGFAYTLQVTVPGEVTDTNASAEDGHTVTWVFDTARDADAIHRMDAMTYRVEFVPSDPALPEYRRARARLVIPPAPGLPAGTLPQP